MSKTIFVTIFVEINSFNKVFNIDCTLEKYKKLRVYWELHCLLNRFSTQYFFGVSQLAQIFLKEISFKKTEGQNPRQKLQTIHNTTSKVNYF